MTKFNELAELGQAIWLDYIRCSFTKSFKSPMNSIEGKKNKISAGNKPN